MLDNTQSIILSLIHILDVGALGFGNGGHQVGERHADHNFAACILNSGDQGVNQLSSLGSSCLLYTSTTAWAKTNRMTPSGTAT